MSWDYKANDAGINLFTACLHAGAPMEFRPGARILEACCAEEDWLQRAADTWPDIGFVGIDQAVGKPTNGKNWQRYREDLLREDAFARNAFDGIVSLSAIEHIGLGHYGDPKDADGDTKAIENIWRWLKPGGWFYFDVPYDPLGYKVLGTECRVYDDVQLWSRLIRAFEGDEQLFTAFADSQTPGTLIEKPTQSAKRYYYVSVLLKKS